MPHIEFDLATLKLSDLGPIDFSTAETVIVNIPMPSVGRTNQHIDICWDYVDASWAAERLAATARSAVVTEEYILEAHLTRLRLTLIAPGLNFGTQFEEVVIVYQAQHDDESGEGERYQALRDAIADYQESLADCNPRLPALVDSYFANLVSGAYHQTRYDAPDYFDELVKKHPEHELGFYRSAYSGRLGGNCYACTDSWLVPNGVELDRFFSTTDQNYRLSDFMKGEVLVIAGKSFVLSDGMVAYFPMSEYFKSRACASFTRRHDEDSWPPDHFGWIDATFTHSPLGESLSGYLPDSLLGTGPRRESCLIHSTGTLVVIDDGSHSHVLYDTKPLDARATKNLHEKIGDAIQAVSQRWACQIHSL